MSDSEIILYDLPSKGRCACWSLNPWKTRLALNYKNIPYKTEWTEYPDVAPKLKSFGLPPNESGVPYSIPTVRLPDGSYLQDSKPIAYKLESLYPAPEYPSLNLSSPLHEKVQEIIPKFALPLRPVWMPRIPTDILNEKSAAYFNETREKIVGMPLSEYGKKEGGEEVWAKAEPGFKELAEILKANDSGPFVEGDTPSYSDFIIVGMLHFFKVIDDKIYERIVGIDDSFAKVYDACKPWLKRDDH
ncbi:glutathione s-transferase protein [Rutstroemia sp. NJR-2017a WRK4]|nr:glutathione s-transferase protein [Rutstroemia sp. NJR-2017a WRK4]